MIHEKTLQKKEHDSETNFLTVAITRAFGLESNARAVKEDMIPVCPNKVLIHKMERWGRGIKYAKRWRMNDMTYLERGAQRHVWLNKIK